MNIKATYKYQMREYTKATIVYYAIMALLAILGVILAATVRSENVTMEFNGLSSSSGIFIFVLGLCSFKEAFGMMVQNGVSRRSFFTGKVLSMLSISGIMAVLTLAGGAIAVLLNGLFAGNVNFSAMEIIDALGYSVQTAGFSPQFVLYIFLFNLAMYLLCISFGVFLTMAFYKMNKLTKILVSVGVPALFIIILPLVDLNFTKGAIYGTIGKMFDFCLGITSHNPYAPIISFCAAFAVLSALCYLLIRRAQVKEP